MNKSHCIGCKDDFYNGKNDLGVTACWNLEVAELIMRKEVHYSQVPPWTQAARELPDCYSRPHFIYVHPARAY